MSNETIETIIGDDIIFKGNLRFGKTLQIDGQFKGTIESDGKLIIGEKGRLNGDINIDSLIVKGELHGNVDASKSIKIIKNGTINGDIKTPDIEIESGAKFIGNCVMN